MVGTYNSADPTLQDLHDTEQQYLRGSCINSVAEAGGLVPD